MLKFKKSIASLILSSVIATIIPALLVSADVYSDLNPGWPTPAAHRITALDKYSSGNKHSSGMDILPDVKGTNPEVLSIADNGVVVRVYNGCVKTNSPGHAKCPADKVNLTSSGAYTKENNGGNEVGVVYTVGKNKYYVGYCHLKKDTIKVKRGDKVNKGTVIGLMGSSGSSTATHLHLDIGLTNCGYYKQSELQNTFDYYINNPKNIEVLKTLKVTKKMVSVKSKYASVIQSKGVLDGDYYTFKHLKSPMLIEEGTYEIENAHHSGYVLDIKDGSTANKANLQLYKRNNSAAQQFKLVHMGNDYYQIVNNKSNLALDAQNGDTKSGTNVWQYTKNNTDAQIWKITKNSDGTYLIANKKSGLLLQTAAGKSKNGINVNISKNNSNKAQRWKMKKVTPSTAVATTPAKPKQTLTISTPWAESITKNSVKIKSKVSYTGTRPTEVGLMFGTNKNKLTKNMKDKITFTKNPFDVWYQKTGLKSGTTYYYQIYAIVNGKTQYSEVKSFKTKK